MRRACLTAEWQPLCPDAAIFALVVTVRWTMSCGAGVAGGPTTRSTRETAGFLQKPGGTSRRIERHGSQPAGPGVEIGKRLDSLRPFARDRPGAANHQRSRRGQQGTQTP